MKKIFFQLFSYIGIFLSFQYISFAEACPYQGKIDQCSNAIESLIGRSAGDIEQGGRIKSITDFPCIQDNPEMRIYQIVMDEKFSEIDEEMNTILNDMYTAKDFFMGKESEFDALDGVGMIENFADQFYAKFDAACSESFVDVAACAKGELSTVNATSFIKGADSDVCRTLAKKKVKIFKQIAINGLLLNSSYLERDAKKKYNQQQRTKYDEVLDLMMLHLSYIERMWQKTSTLNTNIYGGK